MQFYPNVSCQTICTCTADWLCALYIWIHSLHMHLAALHLFHLFFNSLEELNVPTCRFVSCIVCFEGWSHIIMTFNLIFFFFLELSGCSFFIIIIICDPEIKFSSLIWLCQCLSLSSRRQPFVSDCRCSSLSHHPMQRRAKERFYVILPAVAMCPSGKG